MRPSTNTEQNRKRKMLEKEIEAYLNKRVKETGGLTLKWISTVTGVPDRIVLRQGVIRLVELKTPTGKLSARQEIIFNELERQGFPVVVARSRADVEKLIEDMYKMR